MILQARAPRQRVIHRLANDPQPVQSGERLRKCDPVCIYPSIYDDPLTLASELIIRKKT